MGDLSLLHKRAPVTLDTGATVVHLGGILSQTIRTGGTLEGIPTSESAYARFASLVRQTPGADFQTLAIGTALTKVGVLGASIVDDLGGVTTLYAAKLAQAGMLTAGAYHRSYTFGYGMVLPRRLSCAKDGNATLDYSIVAFSNAEADPFVLSETATLPTASDTERFTLGDTWTVGGISLTQPTYFEIDFGISEKVLTNAKQIWPSFVFQETILPVIRLRGSNIQWYKSDAIPTSGIAATHANTKFFLAKRASAGKLVADGTAEHVKFTAAGMAIIDNAFDANDTGEGEVSVELRCTYDGSNAPVIFSLAAIA